MSFWKRISDWFNGIDEIEPEITITDKEWKDGQLTVKEMEDYSEIDDRDIRDYTDEWMFEEEAHDEIKNDRESGIEMDF